MDVKQIKLDIKRVAKAFDLEYNNNWFDYIEISGSESEIIKYLLDCPDPVYSRFGKTSDEKIENLYLFINSEEYKRRIKSEGGQVSTKYSLKQQKRLTKMIKDRKIKFNLVKLNEKIHKKLKKLATFGINDIALITKSGIGNERDIILRDILRHEWIHILLFKNKIVFKRINKKYYVYDEGMATFLEFYLNNNLNDLEKIEENAKDSFGKFYYSYAIKFRELIKDKSEPRERKKEIFRLMKDLKP